MDYKLFDDYITLQALLKEIGIIQSGGAIKNYLAEHTLLVNGQDEKRRGKKLRIGDQLTLVDEGMTITLTQPSDSEIEQHQMDLAEKKRVAALVKTMNKNKPKTAKPSSSKAVKQPVRFPGN